MEIRTLVAGIAVASGLVAIGLVYGQTPGASTISYVASIKENKAVDARGLTEYLPGGRLSATAITVSSMLRTAYRLQDYQYAGAPDWFATKRYDIAAKVDGEPAPSQQVLMQALLKDRFQLVVHNEWRELPTFALVLARSDGKLGPQLAKSDFDCAAYAAGPHPLPQPGKTPPCATNARVGMFSGKAISLAQLANSLGFFANRFTVDKTGLAGSYDVELTWTPAQGGADDASGPSLFTALQEQLGLKLVTEKGLVDVLVVDHAEEPSTN